MLIFVFSATVSRYLKLGSLTSAEEASRYLMIWLAFAGISQGFKNRSHLGLSFLTDRLTRKTQKAVFFVRFAFIALFGCLMGFYSLSIIRTQMRFTQLSSSMEIPIWWVYLAMFFGSVMIVIRISQNTFFNKKPEQEEGGE
jgi:C4-dicarboxylate transporter DctQ subunit